METLLSWFVDLSWGWYIPMYFVAGFVVTIFTFRWSDLNPAYNDPPPLVVFLGWPFALIAGIGIGINKFFAWAVDVEPRVPTFSGVKNKFKPKVQEDTPFEANEWAHWQ